jgi:hypothetical protein
VFIMALPFLGEGQGTPRRGHDHPGDGLARKPLVLLRHRLLPQPGGGRLDVRPLASSNPRLNASTFCSDIACAVSALPTWGGTP